MKVLASILYKAHDEPKHPLMLIIYAMSNSRYKFNLTVTILAGRFDIIMMRICTGLCQAGRNTVLDIEMNSTMS
jgi:hypothetical protein